MYPADKAPKKTDSPFSHLIDRQFDEKYNPKIIDMNSFDGTLLKGYQYDFDSKSHLYILTAHGYGSSHLGQTVFLKAMQERFSCRLFLTDQRAQGKSGGKYCSMGYKEGQDMTMWASYIERHDPQAQIILCGNSLGAATMLIAASLLSGDSHIKGVIADSSYSSAIQEFSYCIKDERHLPLGLTLKPMVFFGRLIGTDLRKSNIIKAASNIKIPVLLIHAGEDTFILPSNLDKIYQALPEKTIKKKVLFPKGGHCLAPLYAKDEYYKLAGDFIQNCLK